MLSKSTFCNNSHVVPIHMYRSLFSNPHVLPIHKFFQFTCSPIRMFSEFTCSPNSYVLPVHMFRSLFSHLHELSGDWASFPNSYLTNDVASLYKASAIMCRYMRMPGANSFETPWSDAPIPPLPHHRCLSLLNLFGCMTWYIPSRWILGAIAPVSARHCVSESHCECCQYMASLSAFSWLSRALCDWIHWRATDI